MRSPVSWITRTCVTHSTASTMPLTRQALCFVLTIYVAFAAFSNSFAQEECNPQKTVCFELETKRSLQPFPSPIHAESNANVALGDLNGDGLADLIVGGDQSFLTVYLNVGTPKNARFMDSLTTVDLSGYSGLRPLFFDIDNDGDNDLIVGSEQGFLFFKNTGTATEPQFTQQVGTQNPFNNLDITGENKPIFADLDSDGDFDLIVGLNRAMRYFLNTGDLIFIEQTEGSNPFSGINFGYSVVPATLDLDGDSDLDVVIGDQNGTFTVLENIGSANAPQFQAQALVLNPLTNFDVGYNSSVTFNDLDHDGDLDLISGNGDGLIQYFENIGSVTAPKFIQHVDSKNNPFAGVDASYYGQMSLVDIDGDGDLDGFASSSRRGVRYFKNIGTAQAFNFQEQTDSTNPLYFPDNAILGILTFGDIDGDGDYDLLIGDVRGRLRFFENTGTIYQAIFTELEEVDSVLLKNLPSYLSNPVFVDIDHDKDLDVFVTNIKGASFYFENIGTAKDATFVERSNSANPLSLIKANSENIDNMHSFIDVDDDGDLDLILTNGYKLAFYENIGSPTHPSFILLDKHLTLENLVHERGILSIGDLDADGDIDILTGSDYGFAYYRNYADHQALNFLSTDSLSTHAEYNFLKDISAQAPVRPYFVDIDGDKDLDAFVVISHSDVVYFYENVGSLHYPHYIEQSRQPLEKAKESVRKTFAFGDIDGDGDVDMLMGASDGSLSYFRNESTELAHPDFQLLAVQDDNPFTSIKTADDITPVLIDLDHDEDLDLVVANGSGTLVYLVNTGDKTHPFFEQVSSEHEPFAAIDLKNQTSEFGYAGSANPTFSDLDHDGDADLLVGEITGELSFYENIGTATQPLFEYRPNSIFSTLTKLQAAAAPFFVDIDGDKDDDLFIGQSNGTIQYFINTNQAVPPLQAKPNSGIYAYSPNVQLSCTHCTKIFYSFDKINYQEFTQNFLITQTTDLWFYAVNEQGAYSSVYHEYYLIDTTNPVVSLEYPLGSNTAAKLDLVSGYAEDEGSKIERVELLIYSEPLYLVDNVDYPFSRQFTWFTVAYDNEILRDSGSWIRYIETEPSYTEIAAINYSVLSIPLGSYQIFARAFDQAGNTSELKYAELFKVNQARADISLELSSSTLLNGGVVNVTGRLSSRRFPPINEDLTGQVIELIITAPDGQQTSLITTIESDIGQFEFLSVGSTDSFPDFSGFTQSGQYKLQVKFAGTDLLTNAESSQQAILVGQSAGYALIIQGKIAINEGLDAHNKTTNRVYRQLLSRGFHKDNIYYLNYNTKQDVDNNGVLDDIDSAPSVEKFNALLTDIKAKLNASPAPFYLILVNHGDADGNFYLDQKGENTRLTPAQIQQWLLSLETDLTPVALKEPRILVFGFCYSGEVVDELSLAGRIVITSTDKREESYKGVLENDGIRSGEYFIEELFQRLGRGENLATAFNDAKNQTQQYTRQGGTSTNATNPLASNKTALQNPQLNAPEQTNLTQRFLGAGQNFDTNFVGSPADIVAVTSTVFLKPEENTAQLSIEVNNALRVAQAPVDIRAPHVELTASAITSGKPAQQREIEQLQRIAGDLQCSQYTKVCQRTVDLFNEAGKYEVYYFVTDNETHDISPTQRSVVYKNKVGNQAPIAFKLLAPSTGTTTAAHLRFSWQNSRDPDRQAGEALPTYTFMIAKDKAFEHIIYQKEELQSPTLYVGDTLEDLATYYWRVLAIDAYGATTASSEVYHFSINMTNAAFGRDERVDNSLNSNGQIITLPFGQLDRIDANFLYNTASVQITVIPSQVHLDKTADLLAIAVANGQVFALDSGGGVQSWAGGDANSIAALRTGVKLEQSIDFTLARAQLAKTNASNLTLFVGYRLGDQIVFNGGEPLQIGD